MAKLHELLPMEFEHEHFDSKAYKLKDVEVIKAHHRFAVETAGHTFPEWPGKHSNVHVWFELANGKKVGWNENPSRGWTFPVLP